jgi:photosystem II stability/assembly factor-like uncharacterized protein
MNRLKSYDDAVISRFTQMNRRKLLMVSALGVGGTFFPSLPRALAVTGVDVLDSAAIKVRKPSRAILEATTLAGSRIIAAGEHGVIIYSEDNGKNWIQAEVPVDVTLTCIQFADSMLGWVGGHFGTILNTNDGGKTWRVQLNGVQANQLTLTAAEAAVAQGNTSPGVPLAMKRARKFLEDGPNKPFLSLLVLGPQKIIAFGADRMTMITTDGGKTWVDWSLHIDDALSHNLYDSTIIGPNIYLAGEHGLIFQSADAGLNFKQLPPPSDVTLFRVFGVRDGSIIVIGVAGSVYRSSDGGTTWTGLELGTQDNLTAYCVFGSGTVLLASQTGTVFASKDDGKTFEMVPGIALESIFDICRGPTDSLFYVGNNGVGQISDASFDS